ncbi:MAG: DUF4136 domain-containing protein [Methylococcaceae bacterium]|nr:DUF4136 domain-containing protein [Methylococcaceae bacterium]
MQKRITLSALLLASLLLNGCANTPTEDIKINAETNPKINVNAYQSYTWLGSESSLNDPEQKWQPSSLDLAGDIKYLIDRELRKRNIYSATENAEIGVAYFLGIDMAAMQLKQDPESATQVLKNIPKGALVITLIDMNNGYIIWAGTAQAEVGQQFEASVARERLDYTIRSMFQKLSPRGLLK